MTDHVLTRFRDGIVRQRAVTTSKAVPISTHGDRFLLPTAMVPDTVMCELNTIHAVMQEQNLWLDGRLSKPIVEGWFTIFAEAIGVAISLCRSPIGGNASTEIKTALHTFLNKHVLRDVMPDNIINQTLPNGNLPQQADVEARTEAYTDVSLPIVSICVSFVWWTACSPQMRTELELALGTDFARHGARLGNIRHYEQLRDHLITDKYCIEPDPLAQIFGSDLHALAQAPSRDGYDATLSRFAEDQSVRMWKLLLHDDELELGYELDPNDAATLNSTVKFGTLLAACRRFVLGCHIGITIPLTTARELKRKGWWDEPGPTDDHGRPPVKFKPFPATDTAEANRLRNDLFQRNKAVRDALSRLGTLETLSTRQTLGAYLSATSTPSPPPGSPPLASVPSRGRFRRARTAQAAALQQVAPTNAATPPRQARGGQGGRSIPTAAPAQASAVTVTTRGKRKAKANTQRGGANKRNQRTGTGSSVPQAATAPADHPNHTATAQHSSTLQHASLPQHAPAHRVGHQRSGHQAASPAMHAATDSTATAAVPPRPCPAGVCCRCKAPLTLGHTCPSNLPCDKCGSTAHRRFACPVTTAQRCSYCHHYHGDGSYCRRPPRTAQ